MTARGRGWVSLTVLTALLLGACDDQPEPDGPRPIAEPSGSPSASVEPGPRTVSVSVYGDRAVVAAYRTIAELFMDDNPSVKIELSAAPDAQEAAARTAEAAKAGRAPDVFLLDQTSLPTFVEAAAVQPLDGLLEDRGLSFGDDFQRGGLTAFSAAGDLQCMPADMSPLVVYYNKELIPRRSLRRSGFTFPRRGDPWEWADFEAAARAVAGIDQLGPIKGTYLPPSAELVTALLRSAGVDVVDDEVDPRTLTLSDATATETLGQIATLARDPAVSVTAEELARRDAVGWFTAGELAMLIGSRADLPRLRAAEGLDFDVVTLPGFGRSRSISRVSGWCLSADTEVTDAAADFIAYAVGPRAARVTAATGVMVPARLDALTSNAFVQPGRLPRHHDAFVTAARLSDPLPYSVSWPRAALLTQATLRPLFTDPDTDLDATLARRLQRLDAASVPLFTEDPSTG